jgi:hypothetical protein
MPDDNDEFDEPENEDTEPNPGHHETLPKLPAPSSNQPAPAESGSDQIPF